MKKFLNKFSDVLNSIAIAVAITAIVVTAVSCFVQVFSRYVLNNSFSWTEELCRYASIVVYMFGFSIATKHGTNPKIDALSNLLKGKGQNWHAIYCAVATIVCAAFIIWFGIKAMPMGARSRSSVLGIPASYMYVVIMVSMGFCAVHSLAGIVNDVDRIRGKEAEV